MTDDNTTAERAARLRNAATLTETIGRLVGTGRHPHVEIQSRGILYYENHVRIELTLYGDPEQLDGLLKRLCQQDGLRSTSIKADL